MDIRGDAGRGGLGHGAPMATGADLALDAPVQFERVDDDAADEAPGDGLERGLAIVAVIAAIAWIGAMLWMARASLPGLTPVALAEFIAALCVVPALIGILWLLGMRASRAEARRFGRTAATMRGEAAALERHVALLTNAIEANRLRLGEQAATLLAIGETAQDQLSTIGSGLAEQIRAVDSHTRALVDSAASTQANLGILLASIPRAESAIEAAARLMHQTGLSTSEHASALHAQIVALGERGRESELVAGGAAQKLEAHIMRMEATSETAGARLEAVTGEMSGAVDALLGRTADAVDQARRGIAAQGDAMLAMITASQAALDSTARESADALAERIATVEAAIDRIAERLETQRISGDAIVTGLDRGLADVGNRLDMMHEQGVERSQLLAASISALGGSATAMTEALRTGEAMATRTIGTTETLLVALDAAAREIDETLPEALARLDQRIAASKTVVVDAKPELLALVTAAQSTHEAIEAIADVIAEQRRTLDTLSGTLIETLNTGRAKADELGQMVDETIGRTHRFSDEAAPQLIDALLRVRDTATVAADRARETLATVIPEAATALESASADAMRRATSDTVERQVRAIGEASDAAVVAATRATERLARQVQEIVAQTAIVETRIDDARAEREEAESNTFARRAALLIESLHSASIDITKAFAPEVSDSAWAAYLKGDRGVFTRRAVRILDASEARDVARYYDDDDAFRDLVNRYIHDFEAMLRAILSQRDGAPMSVTLLSSDMGKLYVALAQAIERLR